LLSIWLESIPKNKAHFLTKNYFHLGYQVISAHGSDEMDMGPMSPTGFSNNGACVDFEASMAFQFEINPSSVVCARVA